VRHCFNPSSQLDYLLASAVVPLNTCMRNLVWQHICPWVVAFYGDATSGIVAAVLVRPRAAQVVVPAHRLGPLHRRPRITRNCHVHWHPHWYRRHVRHLLALRCPTYICIRLFTTLRLKWGCQNFDVWAYIPRACGVETKRRRTATREAILRLGAWLISIFWEVRSLPRRPFAIWYIVCFHGCVYIH
jgi:hypothetical protein